MDRLRSGGRQMESPSVFQWRKDSCTGAFGKCFNLRSVLAIHCTLMPGSSVESLPPDGHEVAGVLRGSGLLNAAKSCQMQRTSREPVYVDQ